MCMRVCVCVCVHVCACMIDGRSRSMIAVLLAFSGVCVLTSVPKRRYICMCVHIYVYVCVVYM